MTRAEFLTAHANMTQEEKLEAVKRIRAIAAGRIPPEVALRFRELDAETTVSEHFIPTAFTEKTCVKTHVFAVKSNSTPAGCPIMINVHGGGFVLEHTERDIFFSRRIAARLNCLVLDVDYVLAPEYPFPAALEELECLLDVLPELAEQFGGDIGKVIVCGQSAGGNLLAAVLQRKRFATLPGLKGQILCYPPMQNDIDLYNGGELDARGETTELYFLLYCENIADSHSADTSPVYASDADLQGLPVTYIFTAELDNLTPGTEHYADWLKSKGIPVTYRCFTGCHHGFVVNLYDDYQGCEDAIVEASEQLLG